MNQHQIAGNWQRLKGKVKEQWGKLRGHEIDAAIGRHDQLRGRIRALQALVRADSDRQLRLWERQQGDLLLGVTKPR